ncbi:hypothetical protein LM13656_150105 [Listeria monocytogenes]|nr:hypothetical protein LM1000505_130550 [Listeria monocytogenes]CUK33955.1 hypothetical protein LM13656_150105 [Listeria monocytogenes]CUK78800.1 hypothetical protein LM601598_130153 [Listeria monocytogenes]CUK97129.1 hypothetical protein LM701067_140548 [Listeria monocytogenes]CUL05285.1 hypothetical protein LM701337_100099 [Listeria monocytogenes]
MFILFSAALGVDLSATYFCATRRNGLECSEKILWSVRCRVK